MRQATQCPSTTAGTSFPAARFRFAEVVFVAHDRREVEIVRREPDGSWSREIARAGEVARLASIECDLPVDEIYRDPLG